MTNPLTQQDLRKASQNLHDNRDMLVPDLARLEDYYQGDLKYAYNITFETVRDRSRGERTFENGPGQPIPGVEQRNVPDKRIARVYPPDKRRGDIWPETVNGQQIRIETIEGYVSGDAVWAQNTLAEARAKGENLEAISTKDVEALEDIPERLAEAVDRVDAAKDFFTRGETELNEAIQAISGANWNGDGSQAYLDQLKSQLAMFTSMKGHCNTLRDAEVAVGQATIETCTLLAEIYLTNKQKMWDTLKDCLNFASGGYKSWTTYANKLLDKAKEIDTNQAKNFRDSLKKINDRLAQDNLLDKTRDLKVTYWPSPEGDALNGPWGPK